MEYKTVSEYHGKQTFIVKKVNQVVMAVIYLTS